MELYATVQFWLFLLRDFQIISTFPKEWFEDLEEDKTMPQLENLGRFLVSVARTLYSEGQQNKRDFDKKDSR